jgi:hypothetical protein
MRDSWIEPREAGSFRIVRQSSSQSRPLSCEIPSSVSQHARNAPPSSTRPNQRNENPALWAGSLFFSAGELEALLNLYDFV